MFTFKDCITTVPSFRFVYDHLPLCSSLGRKALLQIPFISNAKELETCMSEIEEVLVWQSRSAAHIDNLKHLLASVQDIFSTLFRLKNGDTLDDIEFFEIKKFALTTHEITKIFAETSFSLFSLNDVSEVVKTLDPERTFLSHFYIYSSYSKELSAMRSKSEKANSPEEKEDLLWQISKLEHSIRLQLAKKLLPFAAHLEQNLQSLAKLDLLIAKATLAIEWNCCKPEISENKLLYKGVFHPVVSHRLIRENAEFQPVDIELQQESCLITGANMTGKSIFLRTIAFSQWMFQFGFYVPAQQATIVPVEKIHFVAGDSDTENTGLSSFVNEIFHIHHILQEVKEGKKMLVLVDEFARTTNPREGSALVSAFLAMMNHKKTICLATTHYSNVVGDFRRLRVKGIQWDRIEQTEALPHELNKYIDYQLENCNEKTVPEEAVRIAEILAINDAFISLVKKHL